MKIPLCVPFLGSRELAAVKKALASGWLTDGPQNIEFEKNFAAYLGVKRAVTLNSCTSALQLALEALNIKGEVILPSFTFVASANAVVKAGAVPVFCDIEFDTCNINPSSIEKKITPKTEAIMVVHFAGQSANMKAIMNIARKHNLHIIEDAAETIGGMYKGKMAGSFSTGCFSFFPTKNITTGEGGMLTTNDDTLADMVKTLAAHGISKRSFDRAKSNLPWRREAVVAGYNYRMSALLAAIGVEQLKKLDSMNERRRAHAAYLNKRINFDELRIPLEAAGYKHVYQMYTVKIVGIDRDRFVQELRSHGVMASVHFDPPVHLQEYYRNNFKVRADELAITEKVSSSIVTLPMYPGLTKSQLNYIVKSIGSVLKSMKRSAR